MTPISRRHAVVFTFAALAGACRKQERCRTCGMRIDPASPWRAELTSTDGTTAAFDTPKCAFTAWRSAKVQATGGRFIEYYDQKPRDAAELRFMVGGDVAGPMGADLVPVDPSRASRFIQDHGAHQALRVDEVTAEVLAGLH